MKTAVIIPAAGVGRRYGAALPKQFSVLAGDPILLHTLRIFQASGAVDSIVIALSELHRSRVQQMLNAHHLTKVAALVTGGAERQDSVRRALENEATAEADIVLVHDAVRPCITTDFVEAIIEAAAVHGAAIPGLPLKETVKEVDAGGKVQATPPRAGLRSIQTPQGFRREILKQAYEQAPADALVFTDDAAVVEKAGFNVQVVDGLESNIKITTPADRWLAERFLQGTA